MQRWPEGLPIQVELDALDVPRRLQLHGRWQMVSAVVTRWRVRQHWWRAPLWREYLSLATSAGYLITLVRDLPRGEWRLSCFYD